MKTKSFTDSLSWRTVIWSGNFLVGVIGGVLISEYSLKHDPTVIGLLLMCVVVIVVLGFIVHFTKKVEQSQNRMLDILGSPAELIFELSEGKQQKHLGRLGELLRTVSTGDEILIMSYYKRGTTVGTLDGTNPVRHAYYETLLEKAAQKGVTYRRIFCFEEGIDEGQVRVGRVRPHLIEHCASMLKLAHDHNKRDSISIKKATANLGADIFIIKDKVASIGIDLLNNDSNSSRTIGSLIFHASPNRDIVQMLYTWFMETDGRSAAIKKVPE